MVSRETPLRYCEHCEAWHPKASWSACSYRARVDQGRIEAVQKLLDMCHKISENAVIEARLVQQALDTGRVPVLERKP